MRQYMLSSDIYLLPVFNVFTNAQVLSIALCHDPPTVVIFLVL